MTVSGFRPLWNGDETVIVNGQSYQVSSVSSSGESVSITGVLSAAVYNAVYPAEYFQNGMQYFEVPRVQEYIVDGNGHQLVKAPMGAYCTQANPDLVFTPMGSLLQINVQNNTGREAEMMLDSISVEASDVALWGHAQVNDLDLNTRSFTFQNNNANHRSVIARVDNGLVQSIGKVLSASDNFSVFSFVPAIPNTINNKFTICVYAHIVGDNSAVEYSYTMSQSNDFSGSIPKGCLAQVPFSMNVINEAEIRPFNYEDCLLAGAFTVGEDENENPITVRFSKGNLQYHCLTGIWQFAEHQYDYVGDNNRNISNDYDGWIDLFGFGTSGFNGHEPTTSVVSESSYLRTDLGSNYDWGMYNAISNGGNVSGQWRTLSHDEWKYLIRNRTGCANLYGLAKIVLQDATDDHASVEVYGAVVLCDNFQLPQGCGWTPRTTVNSYTLEQWQLMENAGAMFLPAAGERLETGVRYIGTIGRYWSSTYASSNGAYVLNVSFGTNNSVSYNATNLVHIGASVRLVKN